MAGTVENIVERNRIVDNTRAGVTTLDWIAAILGGEVDYPAMRALTGRTLWSSPRNGQPAPRHWSRVLEGQADPNRHIPPGSASAPRPAQPTMFSPLGSILARMNTGYSDRHRYPLTEPVGMSSGGERRLT